MCKRRFNSGAIAGLIALAVVVIAYSCSVREDRKVAKDEVGITMLSIEQRQEVMNRLGKDMQP